MINLIPPELHADVQTLWDFHNLGHQPRPVDVGIGLGGHDLGVATHAAELYHRALFPELVFTGANAPTTVGLFPRGEAVHYRDHARELGVPDDAILLEPRATNTGENIEYTRRLLLDRGRVIRSVMLICRPYQQRRAYATARKVWPEVEVVCASRSLSLDEYAAGIGDIRRLINMMVGDTQRITVYAEKGFAIAQDVPDEVHAACRRLIAAGFTERLVRPHR
jgi:uncharacterized SAM-binding protein YcdF (DUF218 family)